jgi:hypothetical protein
MSLATALFALGVLVIATVAVPIAVASMVQRRTPTALWLRRHVRWLWTITALCWLASLLLELTQGSRFARLDLIVTALGFLVTVCLALLHRPSELAANPLD